VSNNLIILSGTLSVPSNVPQHRLAPFLAPFVIQGVPGGMEKTSEEYSLC